MSGDEEVDGIVCSVCGEFYLDAELTLSDYWGELVCKGCASENKRRKK